MPLFTNYQKMKRNVDLVAAISTGQGLISNTSYFTYDHSGNPLTASTNIGTQQIQSTVIYRDALNRAKKIQYIGIVNGMMNTYTDQNSYNTIQQTFQSSDAYKNIGVTNIDDSIDESTIPITIINP